jgi:hypothetical protein
MQTCSIRCHRCDHGFPRSGHVTQRCIHKCTAYSGKPIGLHAACQAYFRALNADAWVITAADGSNRLELLTRNSFLLDDSYRTRNEMYLQASTFLHSSFWVQKIHLCWRESPRNQVPGRAPKWCTIIPPHPSYPFPLTQLSFCNLQSLPLFWSSNCL